MEIDGCSILEYAPSTQSATELQFGVNADAVRITFAVRPKWMYALQSSFWFLYALFSAFLGALPFTTMVKIHRMLGTPVWSDPNLAIYIASAFVLPLTLAAVAIDLYRLRRWGRVSRTLTATSTGLTFHAMGWLKPRDRFWPADQIREIALHQLKGNTFPGRFTARLNVSVRGFPWNLNFRLLAKDGRLPAQMAEQLSSRLDRPLKIHDARV